jgi:hypothetical protein
MVNSTSTIELGFLFLILASIAQWVGIFIAFKSLKKRIAMTDEQKGGPSSGIPVCAAAAQMVAEHIDTLATHTAELKAMRETLGGFMAANEKGHDEINRKLDNISNILMRGGQANA